MGVVSAIRVVARQMAQRMRGRGRSGNAAIEFAMVAPVLFLFLFGIMETGVLFFGSAILQNATDDTARLLRTGQLTGSISAATLKSQICSNITGLISWAECNANLQVDMRAYNTFSSASYPSVTNANGSLNTAAMQVQATANCQVVLVRVFYPWSIMTPLMAPLLQNAPGGQYILSSAAAFRSEPYLAGSSC